MRDWIKRNKFPLVVAVSLIAIQSAVFVALANGGAPGRIWSGTAFQNANDQAIYIGYVEQVRDGALGLRNLYAPFPQKSFFHPFYVAVGLLARLSRISSGGALIVALWIATACTVFLLHAVSRHLAKSEREASVATLLVVFCGGFGWVPLLWYHGHVSMFGGQIPDVNSQGFLFPTLFMGPHIPLAYGLLPYVLLSVWKSSILQGTPSSRWSGWIAALVLTLICPYVIPIVVILLVASVVLNAKKLPSAALWTHAAYGLFMALGAVPHVWSFLANWESRGLLLENNLPLSPVWLWILVFCPWIFLAAVRLYRRCPIREEETWLVVWVVATVIVVLLPFQWDQKLITSWHALLVWFGLPVLMPMWNWLARVRILLVAAVGIMCVSSAYVVTRQLPFRPGSDIGLLPMYVLETDMQAWRWVENNTRPDVRALCQDEFTGIWGAPFMQRSVWMGHPIDTPQFAEKMELLRTIPSMSSPDLVAFLDREAVGAILTSRQSQTDRYLAQLAGTPWHVAAQFGGSAVIVRE